MLKNSATANVNGIDIYYELQGEGPFLVLIEGLGAATWFWEKQAPEFARHFTTLIFDNRGAGKSAKPPGPYSISMMANDLAALLTHLEIPRAHLLGVSMGGFIAQQFTLTYPEKVDRLVLAATGNGGLDMAPMSTEVFQVLLESGGTDRAVLRKKLSLAFSKDFMETPEIERLIDIRLNNSQPRTAFMAQAQAGAAFDRSAYIHRIQNPCLIMAATGDQLVPVENAHILAQKIPHSQLKIFKGFGHQFLVENAREFNRDVIEFLKN